MLLLLGSWQNYCILLLQVEHSYMLEEGPRFVDRDLQVVYDNNNK